MEDLFCLLIFFVMTAVIVLIHEAGHYWAAGLLNVPVREFSIGMGKALLQKKGKKTILSLRALPLGGYCDFASEQKERELDQRSVPVRIAVLSAGVLMNTVFAFVLFFMVFALSGYRVHTSKPVLEFIQKDSPAERAGLQKDDQLVWAQKNGQKRVNLHDMKDLKRYRKNDDQSLLFGVLRDGAILPVVVTPEYNQEDKAWQLGIQAYANVQMLTGKDWIPCALDQVRKTGMDIAESVLDALKGDLSGISGPIGISEVLKNLSVHNLAPWLAALGVLSMNVAFLNILPLPILDGGRMLICLCEGIFHKKMSAFWMDICMSIGCLIFGFFILFLIWRDMMNLL